MKINTTLRILAFVMVVLMFSAPFATLAQESMEQSDVEVAETDAKRDANTDLNIPLWFGLGGILSGLALIHDYGCVLSVGGLVGAYFYRPNPPATRFVGKSSAYVDMYAETYKNEITKLQILWSTAGCLTGCAVITGFSIIGYVRLGITAIVTGEQD